MKSLKLNNMKVYKIILPFLFVFIATSSCVQTSTQEKPQTSLKLELTELHPGILEGYLSEEELPNSLLLVSPPPREGSAAFTLDQEMATMYVAIDDEERKIQATKDANLHFPEATEAKYHTENEYFGRNNSKPLYDITQNPCRCRIIYLCSKKPLPAQPTFYGK